MTTYYVWNLNTTTYGNIPTTFDNVNKAIEYAHAWQEQSDDTHGAWHYCVTRFDGLDSKMQPIHTIVWDARLGGF